MELTHLGHACVRLDDGTTTLVLDPGTFSDVPSALEGADAVLVTHLHHDHLAVDPVVAFLTEHPDVTVLADAGSAATLAEAGLDRVRTAAPGDVVELGTTTITVGGGQHARVHASIPAVGNVTYLVAASGVTVYHPGDSFDLPPGPVDVLLTPVSGPWLKLGEVIDFVAAAGARVVVPIHDANNSAAGNALVDGRLDCRRHAGDHLYRRLTPGEPFAL